MGLTGRSATVSSTVRLFPHISTLAGAVGFLQPFPGQPRGRRRDSRADRMGLTARAEETKRAESTVPDFDFCYGTRRGL